MAIRIDYWPKSAAFLNDWVASTRTRGNYGYGRIIIIINITNNFDNLYGTVTQPYHYKGASQATGKIAIVMMKYNMRSLTN